MEPNWYVIWGVNAGSSDVWQEKKRVLLVWPLKKWRRREWEN
jgi:hypothetical protein